MGDKTVCRTDPGSAKGFQGPRAEVLTSKCGPKGQFTSVKPQTRTHEPLRSWRHHHHGLTQSESKCRLDSPLLERTSDPEPSRTQTLKQQWAGSSPRRGLPRRRLSDGSLGDNRHNVMFSQRITPGTRRPSQRTRLIRTRRSGSNRTLVRLIFSDTFGPITERGRRPQTSSNRIGGSRGLNIQNSELTQSRR